METPTHSAPPARHAPLDPAPRAHAPDHHAHTPGPGRRGFGWVWFLLILIALGAAAYFFWPKIVPLFKGQSPGAPAAGAPRGPREIPVIAVAAHKGELNLYLNGLGTVTPFNTVTVRSRVDGEIMKILFQEGQTVKEGQPLIEIDPRPFQVQLTQAEGNYARDAAQLKNAKLDLKRYEDAGSSVAQQQIDTQKATIEQFEGILKADQSQIDNAKLQIAYCHITAPINGRIGLRQIDIGNIVRANDQNGLAVITELQPIAVIFTIPQDAITRVIGKPNGGEGMPVEAWNRDFTARIATGELQSIDNQVDPQTGTLRLKASFANKERTLFPSQFVNARLLVDTLKDVTIVPSAAIQRGPDSTFVYVVKPKVNTVELRTVRQGPTEGDQTVIEEGLAPGEVVVTDGVDKLTSGTKVVARPPGAGGRGAATSAPAAGAASRPSTRPAKGSAE